MPTKRNNDDERHARIDKLLADSQDLRWQVRQTRERSAEIVKRAKESVEVGSTASKRPQ